MTVSIGVHSNELLFMSPKITHKPQEKKYYISVGAFPEEIQEISQHPEKSTLQIDNDMLIVKNDKKIYSFCISHDRENILSSFFKDHTIGFVFCHDSKVILHIPFAHKEIKSVSS